MAVLDGQQRLTAFNVLVGVEHEPAQGRGEVLGRAPGDVL